MKARQLKHILNDTGYIVHETADHVCVGSPLCHDLISVRKDNMELRYALDTFHKGKSRLGNAELLQIWDKLEQLIASGEIKEIIVGNDEIENPLPVFSHDQNYNIVRSVTDEYGWPNTDATGRLMYDNVWFKTEGEAIERALKECQSGIEWRTEKMDEMVARMTEMRRDIDGLHDAKQRLARCR